MARQRKTRMMFSSDFLTMAKANEVEKTVTIPATEWSDTSLPKLRKVAYYKMTDVDIPQPKGAIERIEVSYTGTQGTTQTFLLCNGYIHIIEAYGYETDWYIYWFRNGDKISISATAYQGEWGYDWPGNLAPALTLSFRASYFYPPNI